MDTIYLKRKIDEFLLNWKNSLNKKPLIIKGCRQIGKTESIRHFAKETNYESFIEINFVKEISAKAHGDGYMSFSSNFWLDFVTVWGVIRLNLEPTQKADCISRIFIPKIDSPGFTYVLYVKLPVS